jgi:hypothetical protein
MLVHHFGLFLSSVHQILVSRRFLLHIFETIKKSFERTSFYGRIETSVERTEAITYAIK